jgi:hypothetical protein
MQSVSAMSIAMFDHRPTRLNCAPTGYIELRLSIDVVRRRMFTRGVSERLLAAAAANVAHTNNPIPVPENLPPKLEPDPAGDTAKAPMTAVIQAITFHSLTLFIWTDVGTKVYKVSSKLVGDVLTRAGFPTVKENFYLRLMQMYPVAILEFLDLDQGWQSTAKRFALCLSETQFENWLGDTARDRSWPLDAKPRRGRGRPGRVPEVKRLVEMFIESGEWHTKLQLKALEYLVNAKLRGQSGRSRDDKERA